VVLLALISKEKSSYTNTCALEVSTVEETLNSVLLC